MYSFISRHTTLNKMVMLGIVLGIAFGVFLPEVALKQKVLGTAFVNLLQMLVVPLVFASVFASISGLGTLEQLKQTGLKTVLLYLLTTILAVLLAVLMMNLFAVGEDGAATVVPADATAPEVEEFSFESMILSFIPTNIFMALATGELMQVIVFGVLLGVASMFLKDAEHKLLLNFSTAVSHAIMIIAAWIIKLTPVGVFSLISFVVADQGIDVIIDLWSYMLIVLAVLLLHALVTLPLVLFLFARINPYRYLLAIREAPLMAFSTASSVATLPVSMKALQEEGGVRKETAAFVLPLGATVSMDGTAAYLTIAVMYIANLAGVDMGLGDQLLLAFTVVALSVGVAALPSASLVMMVVILEQVGLPVEYMAIVVAVDRILDMARTSLNVVSDSSVTKIVDAMNRRAEKRHA